MRLSMINAGERVRVSGVTGTDAVKNHLGALGIVAGTEVTVLQVSGGSMIVGVRDGRLAIDGDLSRRIRVTAA
jgi:ferrous iron transport protein A